MCGIFGLVAHPNSKKPINNISLIIDDLFKFSESRGKEASGLAMTDCPNIIVLKQPCSSSQLIKSEKYKQLFDRFKKNNLTKEVRIIGHSRLATNGDLMDNFNNQPVISQNIVGIHNGIITNDNKLWQQFPTLNKQTKVDTEVILKLTQYYLSTGSSIKNALQKVYRLIEGAASIALLFKNNPSLALATNTGSLYYYKTSDFFIFASERYILEQLLKKRFKEFNVKLKNINQLQPNYGFQINLKTLKADLFNLKKASKQKEIKIQPKKETYFSKIIDSSFQTKNFYSTINLYLNSISKLAKHIPDYESISKIRRCTRCILPETMPLIKFDKNGVCNYCRTYKKTNPLGQGELKKLISQYKNKTGKQNCIVALSGGRDSSYGLHYAKNVLKLNPIAYTYDWGMVTDIARRNQSRLTQKLGVEHIIVSADIKRKRENIKKNIEAWLKKPDIAMVPLFMAGDKQAEYYAEELKRKTSIKLVIYCRGNQLEDERFKFGYYGIFDGTPKGVIHNLAFGGKIKMANYYLKQYLNNPTYINSSLLDTIFAYFSAYFMRHEFVYLWHYIPWNEKEIIKTLKQQYNWETPNDTIATWRIDDGTPPFYNYIYYTVQGFTEHDGLRSNQIREGVLTRKEALRIVEQENKPRYEALKWYFDVLGLNGDKVLSGVDQIPKLY